MCLICNGHLSPSVSSMSGSWKIRNSWMRLDECTTSLGWLSDESRCDLCSTCNVWWVLWTCVMTILTLCFYILPKKKIRKKGRKKKYEREMGEPREGFKRVEVWVLGYSIEFLTSNNFEIYWVRFRGIYLGYITKWYLLWFCRPSLSQDNDLWVHVICVGKIARVSLCFIFFIFIFRCVFNIEGYCFLR